jgi:hypothetical protein
MKRLYYLLTIIILLSCQNTQKKTDLKNNKCDNKKLVNYVYPMNNFIKEKTFLYSLKSNKESETEFFEKKYKLKIDKDSLLFSITKNSEGITTDSTVFTVKKGIPKIIKSYTKVDFHPNLLLAKKTIIGNRYCEFTTFEDSFEYKIPTENGEVVREFKGQTKHVEYVKKEFNGIEYNCAVFESKKTLTASFNGKTEKLKGIWKGCSCENLGELYSTTTTENGFIIEQKLEKIIEK